MSRKHKHDQPKTPSIRTLVDIVIPTAGRFDLLTRCLEAIPAAAKDITYTTIIVDNASPKEEADKFYVHFPPPVKVIRNKQNFGYPKGCNQGANRGYSPLIFVLTDDVILDPLAITNAVRAIDDPSVGIVGLKLVFPKDTSAEEDEPRKIQHIGLMSNIRGEIVHAFIGWNENHPKINAMHEVLAVTGAAFITRRSLWNKIGGFNEIYGTGYFEDVDYCMSLRELGYNIIVEPNAVGTHFVGSTFKHLNQGSMLGVNRLKFLQRWTGKLVWTEWMHW